MYVVKVGEYYVRKATYYEDVDKNIYIGDITLSKELMGNLNKKLAENIAKKLNGKVIEMAEEVSCA